MSNNKNELMENAIEEFLLWREENCPDVGFNACWDLIMALRGSGVDYPWLNVVSFHALCKAMKARGCTSTRISTAELAELAESLGCSIKAESPNLGGDQDVILANTILQRKVQRLQDINRVERKGWREDSRLANALDEANRELVTLLDGVKLNEKTKDFSETKLNPDCVGIIQLADTHFNELINLKNNKYDFTVASRRLKLLADRSVSYFKMLGITNVVIASTGDLLNKDDILDKLLNNANNRMKACLLATSLLSQFILHLNEHFKVTFCGVTGNETRMSKDIAWSDIVASDNYDLMLYHMLAARFVGSESVKFYVDDPLEQVIELAGNNVLLIHGHQYKNDLPNGIKKTVAKYSYEDIRIDYIFSGHLHEAYISDNFSRSASMCGQNTYSDKGLQLSGRASQNIGVFYRNKNRDIIKVDLQNYEDSEGYSITKELEAYNTKSYDKLCSNKTIIKVVI